MLFIVGTSYHLILQKVNDFLYFILMNYERTILQHGIYWIYFHNKCDHLFIGKWSLQKDIFINCNLFDKHFLGMFLEVEFVILPIIQGHSVLLNSGCFM